MVFCDILLQVFCVLTFGLVCLRSGIQPPIEPPPPTVSPAPTVSTGDWSMQLDIKGPNAGIARPYYEKGATRWARVITGDETDITDTTNLPAIPLSEEHGCTYPAQIDDLFLCVWEGFIDGGGNIQGIGGLSLRRDGGRGTPYVGTLKFDSADIAARINDGAFEEVVKHEMGHALGLGTSWIQRNKCPRDAFENSPNANREFQALSGCNFNAPTTDDCGHWETSCFYNEVTAPIITNGATISRVTVGALADLGYTVNYNGAGKYTKANLGPSCQCNRRLGETEYGWNDDTVLGNHHHHRARGLSAEAHEKALAHGRAFLDAFPDSWREGQDGRALGSGSSNNPGQSAVVYIEENGELYAVHVPP